MANVNIVGMDELINKLAKADLFDDETQEEMLKAGSTIIIDKISDKMVRSRYTIGHLANKLAPTKIKINKDGDHYITVTVKGKNAYGQPNAKILFVLNYGRSPKYGKIEGDYFWTKGVKEAEPEVTKELTKIAENKLKKEGLL